MRASSRFTQSGVVNFAGRVALVFLAIAIAFALYWAYAEYRNTTGPDIADLERALATAKEGCFRGPPMGPACVEATR
jgi:hypothetical protein